MSLILEALRKSEAERQLGRAPSLLTPVSIGHAPATSRRWLLVATVAVVLIGAIAAAWWLGRNGVSESITSMDSATSIAARQPAPALPAPTEAEPVVSSASRPTQLAPMVAREPLPAVGPADLPSDPDFESTERESRPLPAPQPKGLEPSVAISTQPAALDQLPEVAGAQPAPNVDASIDNEQSATPLRMLSAAERTDLPPLRLNMHVFAEAADRRFVMIDGRRLTEGDQIATDVVLKTIRRDGAVLEIRGHRVLIERP